MVANARTARRYALTVRTTSLRTAMHVNNACDSDRNIEAGMFLTKHILPTSLHPTNVAVARWQYGSHQSEEKQQSV
jgi:hypothetical protein